MTVLPLVVVTSLPSILIFTGSIFEDWSNGALEYWSIAPHPPLHHSSTPSLHSCSAFLFRNMRVKLVSVLLDKCRRGHRRCIAERANRIAHDVAADVENQIEIVSFSVATFDPVKNLFHPVTAFAAGTALAARFMSEKAREIPCGSDHAGRFVHDDDSARAEQASRRLDRLIVQVDFLDLFRPQHGHRSAAGNHALEFLAIGHAPAIFIEKPFERIAHFHFVHAGLGDMPANAEKFGPLALFCAHGRVGRRAMRDDPRQRSQCLDIVHHGWTTEQPVGRWKRGFYLWPSAAAL